MIGPFPRPDYRARNRWSRALPWARTVSRAKPGGASVLALRRLDRDQRVRRDPAVFDQPRQRRQREALAIRRVEQEQVERRGRAADRLHRLGEDGRVEVGAHLARYWPSARSPPPGRSRRRSRAPRRATALRARARRSRRRGRRRAGRRSSPSRLASIENSASRARSLVGRVASPGGATSGRPRHWPAMILIAAPPR